MVLEKIEVKKRTIIAAVVVAIFYFSANFSSCIVSPLDLEGLPCTERGECEKGYQCYSIPGEKAGRCLKPNGKFKLYQPSDVKEKNVGESVADNVGDLEVQREDGGREPID